MARKRLSKSARKIKLEFHKFKAGKLHSGSKKGPTVTSRKQAIAIALSVARKGGRGGRRGR